MEALNTAYLAGVFDSDGSFSIARRYYARDGKSACYVPMAQLTWKYGPLTLFFIKAIKEKYGGSFALCKSTNTNKSFSGTNDYIKWSASGLAAEKLILDIRPFLILKKNQANNLLELRSINKFTTKNRPIEVTEKLEKLYHLNKSLNGKNGWKNVENRA